MEKSPQQIRLYGLDGCLLMEKRAGSETQLFCHGESDVFSDFCYDPANKRWHYDIQQGNHIKESGKTKECGDSIYLSVAMDCKHISCRKQEICSCILTQEIANVKNDDLVLSESGKQQWKQDSKVSEIRLKNCKNDNEFAAIRFLHINGKWYLINMTDKKDLISFLKKNSWIVPLSVGDAVSIADYLFVLVDEKTLELVDSEKIVGLPVELQDVSVSVPKKQLRHVSLQIQPGEFVGVLGPSGCGKSVLIQRLVGFPSYQSGKILIDGIPVRSQSIESILCKNEDDAEYLRSKVAYIPQQVALHDGQTLSEEKNVFDTLHDLHVSNAYIYMLGLGKKLNEKNPIGNFSGGEKTRTAIALELGRKPRLLVFDEPTAGLDPASESDVMEYLKKLADQGRTVICSTHIMANIEQFDKILVLANGKDAQGRGQGGEIAYFGPPGKDMWEYFKKFQCEDIVSVYKTLQNPENIQFYDRHWKNCETIPAPVEQKKRTSQEKRPSFAAKFKHEFHGYWKRMLCELVDFRNVKTKGKPWACITAFMKSSLFLQIILQPFVVMLVLKTACADRFFSGKCSQGFYCAIAVFWLGMNNSIRELVKERAPERGLDRLKGVSLSSYQFAKVSYTTMLCVLQVISFIGCMAIPLEYWNYKGLTEGISAMSVTNLSSFAILLIVCITGAFVSLAISAICKKENKAITWLPIFLIPVLFFSEPIIQNGKWDTSIEHGDAVQFDELKSKVAVKIEYGMPCHTPQILLDNQQKQDAVECLEGRKKAWIHFAQVNGFWILLSLLIMSFAQYYNEITWNGRKD